PWLSAYLAECAHRLLSDRARRTRDLRNVLPWALGFPKKRGPGNLLDISRNRHKRLFALEFAIQLDKGDDPPAARFNACNAIFEGKYANVDDRTLQRWLLEVFGLKKAPPNVTEWRKVTHQHFGPYLLAIRDLRQRMKSRDIMS